VLAGSRLALRSNVVSDWGGVAPNAALNRGKAAKPALLLSPTSRRHERVDGTSAFDEKDSRAFPPARTSAKATYVRSSGECERRAREAFELGRARQYVRS
jgi:hypothetical protein